MGSLSQQLVECQNVNECPLKNIEKAMNNILANLFKIKQGTEAKDSPKDSDIYLKYGVYLCISLVITLVYWGWYAPLDEGIPAQGTVVLENSRKSVQHPQGGIVEEIAIKEGDFVEEGQLLIKLVGTSSQATLVQYRELTKYLSHQVKAYKELVDEGYFPKNQYLDLQRQLQEANAKLKAAQEEMARTEIRAISAGRIMGLQFKTKASVIQAGVKILEIIPQTENLVIEAQIPTHLIDRIKAGLEADIHFTALNQRKTPILSGIVDSVSADKFQEPNRPEISYYTAKIKITEETLVKLGGQEIMPGMPADVIIKFGERSFMNYLFKPISDKLQTSFIEK